MQAATMMLAFAVGAGLVLQVGMNMALGRAFGSPVAASMVNFLVGSAALAVFVLLRSDLPGRAAIAGAPAWAWFGGLLGAMYVTVATLAGPRLGALLLLALTVAGQMVASIIVDHYGLLGFAQQPVTAMRLLGVALLVAGIVLVAR
jgi:transporter family-2 protein